MSSAPGYGAYLHFESHQVAAARSVQMASYKSSSFACFIMATVAAAVCVSKRDHFETRYYLLRCSLALGRFPLTLNFLGIEIHLPEDYLFGLDVNRFPLYESKIVCNRDSRVRVNFYAKI